MRHELFFDREMLNEIVFDVLGLQDPVEMDSISWDDLSDGVYFNVEMSERDAIRMELYSADIEA
jgi:hypothetical protein